ncbi:carboxylic ester hydrolase-like [Cydia amplana]|uniref:carboxylic ester hydrolase-like n=1 Tax=Cydia amplana TaxID=1869771 RepID=UPI002FE509F8
MWNDTLEAVDQFIACPQNPLLYPKVPTREDCLVANIITPYKGTNLSVLVYVHGGAYQLGFGHALSPKTLVDSQKIIAVTFNYRLGAHGFLCLGTDSAPGNAGMKDIVALLRWVQQNIASFGGNPHDVTIAGYSAGSSAVGLLILSRMTAGLFSKAIPESGADVGTWSVQLDPIENAKKYAKQLGFNKVENIQALEEFYQNADFDELMSDAFETKKDSTFHFTPCIERDVGEEIFLHDSPVNIIRQEKYNKVAMLYGFTDMEGLFRMPQFYYWIWDMNLRFSNYLPADLIFKNEIVRKNVAKEIKSFYTAKNSSLFTITGYINYFTDVMFAYPVLRSINLRLASGSENIYLYEYSFSKKYSHINLPGASHC